MSKPSVQLFPTKSARRPIFLLVVAAVALVLFGVGYGLGRIQPEGETSADGNASVESPMPAQEAPEAPAAGNLADLLPGLEAKVAANPDKVDQRVLLGQTYDELGQRDKAIKELRIAHRAATRDARITVLLATVLMSDGKPGELRESYKLLNEAVGRKPEVAPMARLYQGDILVKLGDGRSALKVWKDYLRKMPAGDPQRKLFEDRIALASAPS